MPFVAGAQNATTTPSLSAALSVKACSTRYQAEVTAVFKLVDKNKAQKKIEEIKSVRKEQDQNIQTIFQKIESKLEETEKKDIVADHKEEVLKTIDERRNKIDDLQESIQITKSEVDTLVRKTLTNYIDEDNPKTCPIQTTNAKEIRKINTAELRKLAETKSLTYQKQIREIQEDFLVEVRGTLSELSEELKK
jgi:aminoglycoside phosphotransferase